MAQYFRMVTNRRYWDTPMGDGYHWLEAGLLPGDAVSQLRSADNKLSVFSVSTEEQINRVIAALAIGRKHNKVDRLDFALLDEESIHDLSIEVDDESIGITKDEEVNNWHSDLIHLDSEKIFAIANYLVTTGNTRRFLPATVKELLIKYYGEDFEEL